jgi:pilus assembly protein CpaE
VAKVYVVDDDEQVLHMVGLMLQRGGHEPTLLNNPQEGLAKILADKPDLVVLDVMMPGMSGHDICRQIRANKETANLPVLILTARAQDVDRLTALKSGADDYLSKPVTSQELIERVSHLISARAAEKESLREGVVLSFFSLRGGVGRTTLAVNLAGALRRVTQQEICVVDFSPSGGQAAVHLRLQPRASWADLSSVSSLDSDKLRSVMEVHPSGLLLLPAPAIPQPVTSPSAEMATAVLNLLRQEAAVVVLDLPPMLSPAVLAALSDSDIFIQLVAPDVVSAQLTMKAVKALQKPLTAVKQKMFVLNQQTVEAQLPQAAVERSLNARFAFQVGYDSNQSRALAQGIPLSLTTAQSPIPVVMRRMAEAIWQWVNQL